MQHNALRSVEAAGKRGGRGRGRGGKATELEVKPGEEGKAILVQGKPEAESRMGNIALDIKRPLYEKGPNWEFQDFKKNLLEKDPAKIAETTSLPSL